MKSRTPKAPSRLVAPDVLARCLALVSVAWLSLVPLTASAQSEDAVVVVPVGGVETVELLDRSASAPEQGVSLGRLRVLPASLGAQDVADLKILPDGSYLLAGVDGRGVVVTGPEGDELRFVYDLERRHPQVDAASVAGYLTPGEPARSLFADSGTSVVQIRDHGSGQVSWVRNLSLAGVNARFAQAIVRPGNRVAVASNWPALGISAIDVFTLDAPVGQAEDWLRFANAEHPQASETLIVVPALETVRDLMGLPGGDLLVTTRYEVFRLRPDGSLVWTLTNADFPGILGGEFASARALPSGLVAVATFAPGQWTRPSLEHRVHWYDPDAAAIVATSPALERAPHRLELAGGHGGTGTLGFDAGLDDLERGEPASLVLDSPLLLGAPAYERGDVLRVRAVVGNPGPHPVALAEASIRARPGACGQDDGPGVELARSENLALGAGARALIADALSVDTRFALGAWCARVEVRDTADQIHPVGEPLAFEVVEERDDRPSPVTRTDLDTRQGAFDAGHSDAGDAGPAPGPGSDDGCGCAAAAGGPQPGDLLLTALGLAWLLGARRRKGRLTGRRPWATGRGRR